MGTRQLYMILQIGNTRQIKLRNVKAIISHAIESREAQKHSIANNFKLTFVPFNLMPINFCYVSTQ